MNISNKNKYAKVLFSIFLSLIILVPIVSFAAGLVPCGGGGTEPDCNFNYLMTLINNIINFILFTLAVPLAAIMFAYAGILLLTSGGNSAQKDKAKKVFTGVAMGLVIAAAAWLIVHVILSILGYSGSWIGF